MIQSPPWSIETPEGMRAAVEWTEKFVQRINQGGVWVVPRSGSIYTIDHATKTVTRNASYFGNGDSAVERVFRKMGWRVSVKEAA